MAKKKYFSLLDGSLDVPALEKKCLRNWEDKRVVERYLQKNRNSKKYFSFLDGPITANNPMGIHHAWGRTYKDLWQRYQNMRGFRQRFHNGFDAQGLWVEVEVEKELGFNNKKEIEVYGVAKFVQKCKDRVVKYAKIQTEQSKRLGYFMDWENSYFTSSEDNNYLIWHFLKVCHENGWLYKGKESVPWCPRCQTAISQHEILSEDYRELTHESVVVKFPVVGVNNEYLLVWTTTPWTIPANIALAVDKDINYARVPVNNGERYWLAQEAIKRIFKFNVKPERVVKGEKLVGLVYAGPFDSLPAVKKVAGKSKSKFHRVVATDNRIMPIITDEGTGIVHTAVSAGTEDYKLGKKLGLPMIPVITDDASYLNGLGFLSGKNAKENPRLVLDYLQKIDKKTGHDWVFEIFSYRHRYPVCWRCKEELVWKVTDEWYISMDTPSKLKVKGKSVKVESQTLRQRMIKVAKSIQWLPEFGLKRELDWLRNMDDWLISKKNRYWGLALPIWECARCGQFEVIGSKEELKERAVSGWDKFEGQTPHKPQIDQVKIKCSNCGEVNSRIEPVGNPWLDAGVVTFSTVSVNNKAAGPTPSTTKPAYLVDKKNWDRWVPADFITESFPGQFKNWFYSLIAMSTVLEDKKPFKTVLGYATLLAEDGRPMHKSAGNMIEFDEGADKIGVDLMRFLFVTQNPAENLLFGYHKADEARRLFYLKLVNCYQFFATYANLVDWQPPEGSLLSGREKYLSLLDAWMLMRLGQVLTGVTESLEKFDAKNALESIQVLVDDFSNWYLRRSRDRASSSLETEAKSFFETTYTVLATISQMLAPFLPFISEVLYTNLTGEDSVHLSAWPRLEVKMDNRLLDDMKAVREVVEKAHAIRKAEKIPVRQPLNSLATTSKINYSELGKLAEEEVNVKKAIWGSKSAGENGVSLDTRVTPSLKEEAKTRNLAREIQLARKSAHLDLTDKISVTSPWLPKGKNNLTWLKERTLASKLIVGKKLTVTKN